MLKKTKSMKHYLELIPISSKLHRKQSRMTRLCIILAVFLVSVIFGMADMAMETQKIQAIQTYGAWHAGFKNITDEQAKLIDSRPEVAQASWYGVLNYGLDKGYYINGMETIVCGFDKNFLKLFPASEIVEGEFPQQFDTAVVTKSVKKQLNLSIGDTIQLSLPNSQTYDLVVSGFTGDTSMLNSQDAFGIFVNTELYRTLYTLTVTDTDPFYESMLYIQFTPFCNIQKALTDIRTQFDLEDSQIGQNVTLLALSFQSNDPYMMSLYITAGVLAVLVTIAGILMVTSSLNSNISQRIEFFGTMRCLGASGKQIKKFVRLEALIWCKTAIPIGIGCSILVVWLICGMLRFLSPSIFIGMPTLGISWIGIISGTLVGFITVLLAAQSPAKKAARVSPLIAVSGNAATIRAVKKAANTRFLKVDTSLGIHHAKASRKNLILMVGSFSFSIILFLAFTTAIDFMNHALTPLKPHTPDLQIVSSSKTCSVPPSLSQELSNNPVVKRVFGRSFAYYLPSQIEGEDKTINLVSHEEHQFKWAKDYILEGSLDSVINGTSVLVVYNSQNILALNDTISLTTGTGAHQVSVSCLLSTSTVPYENIVTVICSEELFRQITGENNYTLIDIQLTNKATDEDVDEIRRLAGENIDFLDKRLSNDEAKGAYYSFALFIYGFLVIIALISIFNIFNSIAMSVSSRIHEYGAMRAIGMSNQQVIKMISAEGLTYALLGIIFGCIFGLPINKFLFENLVTSRWGDPWYFPLGAMIIIIVVVICSILFAIYAPAKRIRNLSIIDTIGVN